MHTPDEEKAVEPSIDSDYPVQEYPIDGGWRAWCTAMGAWLVLAATFGYAIAFGVYQDFYTRGGVASSSRISWIGSVQLFLIIGLGIVSGKLLDAGYFRITTIIGSCIYVFSLFMVSIAHHDKYYQIFLSQGVGMGIGAGLLYTPAMAIHAQHWRKRRVFVMGIVYTGAATGGVVYPIMLNRLFQSSTGFGWGVRISAFVILAQLIVGNALMSTNPIKGGAARPKPTIGSILTDVPYLIATAATFFVFLGVFLPTFYLQLYSILHGVDPNTAFYTLAILNASSAFGRTLPNFLADYLGPFNLIVPSGLLCGVLVVALLGVRSTASIIIFAILFGFISGAFQALCTPLAVSLAQDPSEIGIRVGFAFFLVSFACLTGAPIQGALVGSDFAWSKAIIFSAVTIFVGTGLMALGRQLQSRRKGIQKV